MHENENMPPQGDASYDYYPLEADGGDALLPEGQEVVMHRASGHVALIDWELRMVKAEAMFDERECLFLRILLQHKRKVEEQENILGEDYKNVFQKQNFANKAHFRGLCGFSHRYYHCDILEYTLCLTLLYESVRLFDSGPRGTCYQVEARREIHRRFR